MPISFACRAQYYMVSKPQQQSSNTHQAVERHQPRQLQGRLQMDSRLQHQSSVATQAEQQHQTRQLQGCPQRAGGCIGASGGWLWMLCMQTWTMAKGRSWVRTSGSF